MLMLRMLIVGYCYGIRPERRLAPHLREHRAHGDGNGLVKGEGFAVDASVLEANASRYHGKPPEGSDARTPPTQHHATQRAARQCPEAQLNLAYRWFCGLGTEDKIPDHSAFTRTRALSQPRYFPFRLRARRRGVPQGGARRRPIDASLIAAEANKCRSTPGKAWSHDIDPTTAKRAVQDYLVNLDDLAWGAATDVVPKVRRTRLIRRRSGPAR